MRRRRWLALVAGAGALLLTPVMAGAAPLTSAQIFEPVGFFRLCAEAQVEIANIDEAAMDAAGISIGGTIYEDYATDFQYSKSAVNIAGQRILTASWTQYRDAEKTQPYVVRCKMRTAESLTEGEWPPGSENNGGRFEVDPYFGFGAAAAGVATSQIDQPCTSVNQNTIDAVWASLSPAEQAASPYDPTDGTLVTVPDYEAESGPEWLGTTPPLTVNGPNLEVASRALLVPTTAVGSARLKGAHYCTMVAPEYLRDVLLGTAPVL